MQGEKFDYDEHISEVIKQLNEAGGASLMRLGKTDRHTTFKLEEQMTEFANRKDARSFVRCVNKWKEIILKGQDGETDGRNKAQG